MEVTKRTGLLVRVTAVVLTGLAMWFSQMPCLGIIYEPQMPEQLKKDI